MDIKELRDKVATLGSDYLTDEEWVEVIDRLEAAEKERDWHAERCEDAMNERDALRTKVAEMELIGYLSLVTVAQLELGRSGVVWCPHDRSVSDIPIYALSGAQAQPAPEVLSDLTSLLREATDILKWYATGSHIKMLSGRIDWAAERAKLSRENFEYSFELYDVAEYYVEDGSRAYQLVNKLENALDLAGNINNAQPVPSFADAKGE